ncbi:polysaccharide biosynthesis C-terminal domain-containing protein [Roseibium suaedae]|uniref:dTDP-4-dehydrorhamnose 3,5-epimerase n=1 Tax=Roseibium suaedae TaxID=735517 RepID=A0A1M7MXB4_9HYPH|nr:dTDP-4-dehydrorhamnose 3,5-epimerase family protein [Roseibium suaedae]SHM95676.1 dTDP-4-dehydrorhamnose 3,5-epimerase [Roseibium suaedae]
MDFVDIIDGVYVRDLRLITNPKGSVREFVRRDDPDFPGFGQVHIVETMPGIVRAWFRHYRQFDQLSCIRGKVRVGLYDDRPDSPTLGASMDFVIDADKPVVVGIPPMVWHGFATAGEVPSVLVQHNNQAFNHGQPDEEKRPHDANGFPIVW